MQADAIVPWDFSVCLNVAGEQSGYSGNYDSGDHQIDSSAIAGLVKFEIHTPPCSPSSEEKIKTDIMLGGVLGNVRAYRSLLNIRGFVRYLNDDDKAHLPDSDFDALNNDDYNAMLGDSDGSVSGLSDLEDLEELYCNATLVNSGGNVADISDDDVAQVISNNDDALTNIVRNNVTLVNSGGSVSDLSDSDSLASMTQSTDRHHATNYKCPMLTDSLPGRLGGMTPESGYCSEENASKSHFEFLTCDCLDLLVNGECTGSCKNQCLMMTSDSDPNARTESSYYSSYDEDNSSSSVCASVTPMLTVKTARSTRLMLIEDVINQCDIKPERLESYEDCVDPRAIFNNGYPQSDHSDHSYYSCTEAKTVTNRRRLTVAPPTPSDSDSDIDVETCMDFSQQLFQQPFQQPKQTPKIDQGIARTSAAKNVNRGGRRSLPAKPNQAVNKELHQTLTAVAGAGAKNIKITIKRCSSSCDSESCDSESSESEYSSEESREASYKQHRSQRIANPAKRTRIAPAPKRKPAPAPAPAPAPTATAAPKRKPRCRQPNAAAGKANIATTAPHTMAPIPTNNRKGGAAIRRTNKKLNATAAAMAANPMLHGGAAVVNAKDISRRLEHNLLERKRRDDLKGHYRNLQLQIPELMDRLMASKTMTLIEGRKHIGALKDEEKSLLKVLAHERRRHEMLKRRAEILMRGYTPEALAIILKGSNTSQLMALSSVPKKKATYNQHNRS